MKRFVVIAFLATPILAQQPRMASDFEIAQMKQQIERSHDFVSQLSGHLNLGDLYLTRSETTTARAEYAQALKIAGDERLRARKASEITQYATATAYAALASAKLGDEGQAFAAAEEAIRYTSGSAKSWNVYSWAMTLLRRAPKAVSAARNAVTIASRDVAKSPTVANKIDLAVYQYALSSALIENRQPAEAEQLLRTVTSALRSNDFASLRREVARKESFEIYSTVPTDEGAYLSLVNHAGLSLASLLEQRGDIAAARREYERVLEMRTDDPTALAALARLSKAGERERYFAAAFDANPFSMDLVREYQVHIAAEGGGGPPSDETAGAQVRQALVQMHRGEMHGARETLDALLRKFPNNDTLRTLRRETEKTAEPPAFLASKRTNVTPSEEELRRLIGALQSEKVTPEQRKALDRIIFTSRVTFDAGTTKDGQTIFESGRIGDVRFKFSEPIAFAGTFATDAKLTYRILGATDSGLLVEPVRLER